MSGREDAASELVAILDSPFLRALTEPARLEVLCVLLLYGAADVGAIAQQLPQDPAAPAGARGSFDRPQPA